MRTRSFTVFPTGIDLLDHSLRCMGHYSVVISILLLILNDHFLKYQYPGFLTGKLSDFSGLYFFPYLIALLLILISGDQMEKHRLGMLAVIGSAVFFVGIKTVPWFNNLVEAILNVLHGGSSVIVLDPTDLVALPVLILSWRLWNRKNLDQPYWYLWVVVILAAGATLATSCRWTSVIKELYLAEGRIYAVDPGLDTWFVSADQGATWESLSEPPVPFDPDADRETTLPKTVCDPVQKERCFRISGEEIVEASENGGSMWQVAWRIPPGRRKFMERLARSGMCGKDIDLGPYDIEGVGEGDEFQAVVAMGNEGILLLPYDGSPTRVSVDGSTNPTPYLTTDFRTAVMVNINESLILLLLGFGWWGMVHVVYWKPVLNELRSSFSEANKADWIIAPLRKSLILLFVTLVLIGLLTVFGFALYTEFEIIMLLLLTAVALILHPVGQFFTWRRLSSVLSHPAEARKSALSLVMSGAGFLVVGFLPLYLWVMSVIKQYRTAFLLSVFFLILITVGSVYWVRSRVHTTIENIKS